MAFIIQQRPLSYIQHLDHRNLDSISLVVIHCTELPDLAMARVWGEKMVHAQSQTGNSGHFYIDRDGATQAWVPMDHVAHHVRGHNERSIGIELVNTGRYPNWFNSTHQEMSEPYPAVQIDALVKLLEYLVSSLPELKYIAGHEVLDTDWLPSEDKPDIMIRRKLDPGTHFPWSEIMDKIPLKRWIP